MTPLYFGTGKRRLFGVLDPAQARSGKSQAAVICYPWGSEYIFAHRALRHLARQLAARGFNVLRFDYYGTGDSAGEESEVRLAGWREDIAAAIEELKETCDARAVTLIGLRLGASLAAEVAALGRKDVTALVLWDPAVSGSEHLDMLGAEWTEMAHRHRTHLGDESESRRGGRYGLPISDELAFEISAIDLAGIAGKMPARTLCLATERLQSHDAWRRELEARPQGPIALEEISDIRPWVEPDPASVGTLPLAVVGRIISWLAP
ncbi:MAG: alpha/beta fold hydrolase [Hyphomicrobiaceae bacterium]|nr:alpha/beta fold hydrolase [Hyphomicrobiaceae bacterium]